MSAKSLKNLKLKIPDTEKTYYRKDSPRMYCVPGEALDFGWGIKL
jgi:hypothetical protein